ncbi:MULTISPECIES: hypothetical protein [Methylomonas]|uniref:Uncharacterized protein n=1 Tax=Methylomonas koyamae TaxID=702114 RepID=A0A177NGC4_9GAMM|nr:hypothetical protein [Methylomonas koyamae]OAI16664.1 hypothetical protein A1355_09095 [Methylomonas koyamae]
MYYSNMYEFGVHNTTVGVTGFVTCIGVVFVTNQQLYAIHIPQTPARYADAHREFGMFIARTEGPRIQGDILVFCNSPQRANVVNELRPLIGALNVNTSTLYRLNGPGLNNAANAAAVQVDRVVAGVAGFGVSVKYEVNNNIAWVAGGTAPSGRYAPGGLGGGGVPNAPVNWVNVTAQNCQISNPW